MSRNNYSSWVRAGNFLDALMAKESVAGVIKPNLKSTRHKKLKKLDDYIKSRGHNSRQK